MISFNYGTCDNIMNSIYKIDLKLYIFPLQIECIEIFTIQHCVLINKKISLHHFEFSRRYILRMSQELKKLVSQYTKPKKKRKHCKFSHAFKIFSFEVPQVTHQTTEELVVISYS